MRSRGNLQALCLVLVSVCLSACGESANKSVTADSQSLAVASASLGATRPVLTVSTDSLSFQAYEGSGAPAAQLFTGQLSAQPSKPPYIDVDWTGNGLSSVMYDHTTNSIIVSVMPKAPAILGVGTFTDQVTVKVCEDTSCRRHIEGSPKTVNVTYTVFNRLSVYPAALAYAHVMGSSPAPGSKSLSLQGTFVNWTASADASWIQLAGGSGTTPENLAVAIEPSGLSVGSHGGNITLTNNDTGERTVVPVAVQVAEPVLSTNPSALSFGGLEGRYLPAQPLVLALNTGSSAYEWTASVDTGSGAEWLVLSSTSGTVSSSTTPLAVGVNTAGLQGGSYSASLTFTASVQGMTLSRTIPVSLTLGTPLWIPDNGVALVSTPSVSKLSHTVTVKDRWGTSNTPWTATSDQPWLSVTSSGVSGGNLTVVARPTGLTPNTIHYARVTVGFGGNPPQGKEIIEVGLWVGDSAPNSVDSRPGTFQVIEADPVRPYVYVHNGGGTLHVYNLYTASLVTSITGVANNMSAMTISSDGSTLYVLDSVQPRRIVPVNLDTLTPGAAWGLNEDYYSGTSTTLTYARPNGQGMIITNASKFLDATTGASIPNLEMTYFYSSMNVLSTSLDGSMLCGFYSGSYYYYYELYCYGLQYTEEEDGTLTITPRPSPPYYAGSNAQDVAINNDGSRVYVAAASPNAFNVYDGQTMQLLPSLAADTNPNAVEVGPDNRLYGTARALYGSKDLWVYDSAGISQGSYRLAGYGKGVLARQLKVSGDGKRFVAITDDPSLKFATGQ
jgi:hypothetical protein